MYPVNAKVGREQMETLADVERHVASSLWRTVPWSGAVLTPGLVMDWDPKSNIPFLSFEVQSGDP